MAGGAIVCFWLNETQRPPITAEAAHYPHTVPIGLSAAECFPFLAANKHQNARRNAMPFDFAWFRNHFVCTDSIDQASRILDIQSDIQEEPRTKLIGCSARRI